MFDFNKIGMRPRSFMGYKAAVTATQIMELEQCFGHALPDTYKEMLTNYHDGTTDAKYFEAIDEETGIPLEHKIEDFFLVHEAKELPLSLWWAIKNYPEFFGHNNLPFANDGAARIYYFKWTNDRAEIWCLALIEDEEPEHYFLFNFFDELLGALYTE